jgi:hypothetical protein
MYIMCSEVYFRRDSGIEGCDAILIFLERFLSERLHIAKFVSIYTL